jgi:hypothetical protein
MKTHRGCQFTPYYPIILVAPPKWAPEELFDPLDLTSIQGGLHDLPKHVDFGYPHLQEKLGPLVTHIGLSSVKTTCPICQGVNILTLL